MSKADPNDSYGFGKGSDLFNFWYSENERFDTFVNDFNHELKARDDKAQGIYFEDEGFMGEDSFEDHFEDQMDDSDDGLSRDEQESDECTARDAFYYIGSIVGNAYEEGLDERKRRQLLRKKRTKRDPSSD